MIMAKKKFKSNKEKYITYGIYALATGVVLFLLWKYILKDKISTSETDISTPGPTGTTTGTTSGTTSTPTAPVYTNSSVFSVKSPLIKDARVQWIQNAYNNYAKNRKLFGKTPNWATISEDGVYGSKTADAMNRLMGKRSVNWSEVKTRTDYLQSQLAGNSTNFNWE